MANQLRFPAASIQLMMDALFGTPCDTGAILRFYDGVQPAAGGGALSGNNLLAECTLNADGFGACSLTGVVTMSVGSAVTDAVINAGGTSTWARLFKADGTTAVCDLSVGTAGCDINLSNNVLIQGGTLTISSLTVTHPLL